MNRDAAETIALKALAFIAADRQALEGLLAATGVDAAVLAQVAGDPDVLGGVLDHLLADEPRLLRFCEEAGLAPEAPARARASLPGGRHED
jgi:hypothetical protein